MLSYYYNTYYYYTYYYTSAYTKIQIPTEFFNNTQEKSLC